MSASQTSPPAKTIRKSVEFYSIELAELADGTVHVSLTATSVDDQEPQLLIQEIATERVATIDEALRIVRAGITASS